MGVLAIKMKKNKPTIAPGLRIMLLVMILVCSVLYVSAVWGSFENIEIAYHQNPVGWTSLSEGTNAYGMEFKTGNNNITITTVGVHPSTTTNSRLYLYKNGTVMTHLKNVSITSSNVLLNYTLANNTVYSLLVGSEGASIGAATYRNNTAQPFPIQWATDTGVNWTSAMQMNFIDFGPQQLNQWIGITNITTLSTSSYISLINPVNNYSRTPGPVIYNCSANVVGSTAKNASLWTNETGAWVMINSTEGLGGTTPSVQWTKSYLTNNTFYWTCRFCDASGDCGYSSENRTLNIVNYFQNSVSYNSSTAASAIEGFVLNFSYDYNLYPDISATFVYNGINYTTTKTVPELGNAIFTNNINVGAGGTKSFYWVVNLTSILTNTSVYSQTVGSLSPIVIVPNTCAAGYLPSQQFTFFDEQNRTDLNVTANYNFLYGYGNSTAQVINGSLPNVHGFILCMNNTAPVYTIGYGEVDYQTTGYVDRKYYLFANTRATNSSINNSLFDLISTASTSFSITVKTTTLNPASGKYVTLLRWYPDLNSYKTADMGITDDNGQTVLKVKTEDVNYRIGVYQPDGTLIKLINPVRLICQTNPCTYTVFLDSDILNVDTEFNIQKNLSFNPTTKVFTFSWNDPSQASQTINLTVFQDTGIGTSVVCSQISTGFTGIIICDVSAYSGLLRAIVTRTASPTNPLDTLIVTIRSALIDVTNGKTAVLFMTGIVAILLILMGIASPVLAIIFGILAFIPALILGGVTIWLIIAIAVMGGIILHFIRRVQ